MKNSAFWFIAAIGSIYFAGCAKDGGAVGGQKATVADLRIVDKDGSAAMQFGHWLLVVEAVPAKTASIGSTGTINYPDPAGSGGGDFGFGDLKIKQAWNGHENTITVNGVDVKLTDDGKKLAFADHNYDAGETTTTIVIAKDGSTHEVKK